MPQTMRRIWLPLCLTVLAGACTTAPTPRPGYVVASVLSVVDGDTIKVEIDGQPHTVRYIGINTPEISSPGSGSEAFGPEASAKNKELVGSRVVELEKDVSETDKYGRLLRYVWIGDVMVNAEMVRLGYAQVSTHPPDVKYQERLLRLQHEARSNCRGLWAVAATECTEPAPGGTRVIIHYILYDGAVPEVESDEYAQILNEGALAVNLAGWRLNAGSPGDDFVFPDVQLQPGESCRVYTNEVHPETGGLTFGIPHAVWNNTGDCGYLSNAEGVVVSEYCY